MTYEEFIDQKSKQHIVSGFDIDESKLNDKLFPFQKFCVKRALKVGKYALFEDCGLGKTLQSLEWAKQVIKKTKEPVIILCPLTVSGQTIEEGKKFGYEVIRYKPGLQLKNKIYISNYDQLDNIETSVFGGVILDESSIIKSYTGKTKELILQKFKQTKYKLACTATPSPNDPMELGQHSEFLDVMNSNEMLAMFFINDAAKTGTWRLKGHGVQRFYEWVSTWAIMVNNPKDIGFEMEGYELPELNLIERKIITEKRDNGKLFNDIAVSATNFNGELRLTKLERLSEVVDIVNSKPNESIVIWIKHNEEGEYLLKNIPHAIEVTGSDSTEYKEKMLMGFVNRDFKVLITKSKIASFGLNWQHCHNQIFASLDFSFETLYQGIRRSYRFMQKHAVNIYLITTDTMTNVIESIERKQKQFKYMQDEMSKAMNKNINKQLKTKREYNNEVYENEFVKITNGDCVELIKDIPDNSIGFSVFSPPFPEIFTYSDKVEDMGNSTYDEFVTQFAYLVRELYRVIKEGRNVAVHCMDLRIQKGKYGFRGLRDFSGLIRDIFDECGFIYHSRITIWKDPVVQMQRTKAIELLHKQVTKDSTMSAVGDADYILVFRKDGERSDPVNNDKISVDTWQQYASPVWDADISKYEKDQLIETIEYLRREIVIMQSGDEVVNNKFVDAVWKDIDQGNTLQGFRKAREDRDEKHICPLQLDVIERLIHLYSKESDTVYTPFLGIGSELYKALEMGRKGIGHELKQSYFHQAKMNLKTAIESKKQLTLF